MKRRLRKKLRLAEFRELGFRVRFRVPAALDGRDRDEFWDLFIGQAVEGNGLLCGGGSGPQEWDIMLTRARRGSATEKDRVAVENWLSAHGVFDLQIGPLIDIWRPD